MSAIDNSGISVSNEEIVVFLNSASVQDLLDGNNLSVTSNAPSVFPLGLTTVTFSVTDSGGHTVTGDSTVTVEDQTPPQITLNGDSLISILIGSIYIDAGAIALDNVDGDISSNIQVDGSVDTSALGLYQLIFNASDSSGNSADSKIRQVNVIGG